MIDLLEVFSPIREAVVDWFPRLTGGVGLLILGWLCAVVARFLTRRLFRGLQRIVPKRFAGFEASTRRLLTRAEAVFPIVLFWFILLFFAAAAAETVGLPILTAWLAEVINYLPRFFMALLIVFGGLWAGSASGSLTSRALSRLPHARMVGRLVHVSLVVVSTVVAINQLGVDLTFITTVTAIVLAGLLIAAALAFGMGASELVSNVLSAHYVQKIYRIGHEIEIVGIRGTLVEFTETHVIIESPDSRIAVPARMFASSLSTKRRIPGP